MLECVKPCWAKEKGEVRVPNSIFRGGVDTPIHSPSALICFRPKYVFEFQIVNNADNFKDFKVFTRTNMLVNSAVTTIKQYLKQKKTNLL